MELVQHLLLEILRYDYAPALHDHTVYDSQVIFLRPIWSYVNVKQIFCAWLTCNYNIFRCWRCSSSTIVCWICDMDIHSGMSVVLCMASTLMSMSWISSSLPSLWLCCESQSAINISGPGLYRIWTLYWWIFNRICCMHYDSIAVSLLNMATNGLWSGIA